MTDFLQGLDIAAADIGPLEETAASLALAAPALTPPPSLRARLLDNLPERTYLVSRAADSEWKPFGPPGVDMKPLMKDPSTGLRSFLVRLQPGAVVPPHHHAGAEHCYVIEGDVYDHEHAIRAGDYELRVAGSSHAAISTRDGAILLIIAGEHDEHPHS